MNMNYQTALRRIHQVCQFLRIKNKLWADSAGGRAESVFHRRDAFDAGGHVACHFPTF